jgi:hypothetical protein
MCVHQIATALSEISELCDFGNFMPGSITGVSYRGFGFGKNGVVVKGNDAVRRFDELVDEIWAASAELHAGYSRKEIQSEVIAVMRGCHENETTPNTQQAQHLLDGLLQDQPEEWTVIRGVNGAVLRSDHPLHLGPFSLYDKEKDLEDLKERRSLLSSPVFSVDRYPAVLVVTDVVSRTAGRAIELADKQFTRFENAIRYMMGTRDTSFYVGVTGNRDRWTLEGHAVSDANLNSSAQRKGPMEPVDLSDTYFASAECGNAKIWALFEVDNTSQIERRIMSAVEWIGRGVSELDDTNAFTQFMFALESLLKHDPKSVIKPSIVASISEMAAFVLADGYDKRCRIEGQVKELYSSRSAIVHGGRMQVPTDDARQALWLAKSIVITLLVDPEISQFSSLEELAKWIKKQKYGS